MLDLDDESSWKGIQRSWNDISARILRKCRVPKQLVVFSLVVCLVVLYAVLNNEVLTVSDELADLKMNVDIIKAFKSYNLVITNPDVVDTTPIVQTSQLSINDKMVEKPKPTVAPERRNRLRGKKDQLEEKQEMEKKSNNLSTNFNLTIEGTLSQIIPRMVEDPNLPSYVYSSYLMKYPAFVLPPPFSFEPKQRNTLPAISGFFQELASHKKDDCEKEDICVHPADYVNLYTNWTNQDPVSKNHRDYIVFFQEPYIQGQIDVLQNRILPLTYECSHYTSRDSIPTVDSNRIYKHPGNVVYLVSPQSSSLFRFIHTILPKLVQFEAFLSDRSLSYLVDLSPQIPIVKELYLRLGIQEEQLLNYRELKHKGDSIEATRLVMTCNTPALHPYLSQRAQYLLHLPHLEEPLKYQQKTIIYLSRRKGTLNSGRRVVNEPELERHLQKAANEAGYQYVSFFHTDYTTLEKTLELWSTAAVVIGPHGGAFANIEFAPKGTVVIEFLPNGAIFNSPAFKEHLSTYQQAMALGHRYYPLMSNYAKNNDMIVSVRDVLTTLKNTIGSSKPNLKNSRVCSQTK